MGATGDCSAAVWLGTVVRARSLRYCWMAMKIVNETRNTTLAERADVARSYWGRLRGLMGRRELPEGSGLVIEPNNSVHTFWMRVPIDVVFVDRDGSVVGLREAMPPNRPFAG